MSLSHDIIFLYLCLFFNMARIPRGKKIVNTFLFVYRSFSHRYFFFREECAPSQTRCGDIYCRHYTYCRRWQYMPLFAAHTFVLKHLHLTKVGKLIKNCRVIEPLLVVLLSNVITTSSLTTLLHGQKRYVPNFILAPGHFLKIVRSFFSNVAGYLKCFMALAIYADILRQVMEFWNEFVLFLNADQIIVNKRIFNCALDTSLIGFSILHHRRSSGILNSALKYATNTCDLFLALAIDEDTYTILIYLPAFVFTNRKAGPDR